LIKINAFQKDGKWPLNTTKAEQRLLLPVTNGLLLDSKAVWIWLTDKNYPRMALWLPKIYRKRAICEVHGTILSGHDALKKTYLRLTNAYFWPNMKKRKRWQWKFSYIGFADSDPQYKYIQTMGRSSLTN